MGSRIAAAGAAVALYGLAAGAAAVIFDVRLQAAAVPADLALHLILAAAVYALARGLGWYLLLTGLVMALLHFGNAMKIAVLGAPVMPDDLSSLRSLLLILDGGWIWLAVGWAVAMAVALPAGVSLRRRHGRHVLMALAAAVAVLLAVPAPVVVGMDAVFGNTEWDQRGNYLARGPAVHLLQETARQLARAETPPSRVAAQSAAERLLDLSGGSMAVKASAAAEPPQRRNLHMIVLESFWDAGQLAALGLSDDPLDPRFRVLWEEGGGSRALSPVFGGYTANAEAEALCGFPVDRQAVLFEAGLRRTVPCLPAWLGAAGYATTASHPNVAAFWNRTNAYRRIGFDVYWSARDFVLDDMNGDFLADSSLYRQVLGKIEPLLETGAPLFNYVLTFFGHLDYPLNEHRPELVAVAAGDDWPRRYVNTVRYKSAELMDFLEVLRERDPDAVIVVFGDHLPFLGNNFGAYAQSGLTGENRGAFTAAMHVVSVATPLLVIDGRRGAVAVGDVPLYRLPSLIRDLLHLPGAMIADLTQPPPGLLIRPLPGFQVVTDEAGEPKLCRGDDADDPVCLVVADWLRSLHTVRADLFAGRQFVLRAGMLERLGHALPPDT